MAPIPDADGLNSMCPWCLEPAHPSTAPPCPAVALSMLVERSAMVRAGELPWKADRATTPIAVMAEWWLWDRGEHDPDELPPPL